jgi:PAS domain S-box-containing protein
MNKKNCWELKKCGRELGGENARKLGVCPASINRRLNGLHGGKNAGRACWLVAGTMCERHIQGTFAHGYKDCRRCDFYALVKKEEGLDFKMTVGLEEMLRESENRYRLIFERAGDAILILDAEGEKAGHIVAANQAAAEMHGYTVDELLTMNIRDLGTPDIAKEVPDHIRHILDGGWLKTEFDHRRKDGTVFPVEITAGPFEFGKHKHILSFERDITERKRAEKGLMEGEWALRQANARLETLLNAIPDIVFFKDERGRYLVVNKATERFLGHRESELTGKTAEDLLPPDLAKECMKSDAEVMRARGAVRRVEEAGIGDKKIILDTTKVPLHDADGNCIGFVGVIRDITEQRKAEEDLRLSSQKWRTTFDAISDSISLLDSDGKILQCNKATSKFFGKPLKEIIGGTCLELMKGAAEPIEGYPVASVKEIHRKESVVLPMGDKWVRITVDPVITDDSGALIGLVHVISDITEQKKTEEELKGHHKYIDALVEKRTAELKESKRLLRNLANHLQTVREEERMTVAREIHDELGQTLTALKFDIAWLAQHSPQEFEELYQKKNEILENIDRAIQTVRKISTELRPRLLDDFGIVAAIEWQVEEFRKRMGIKCTVSIEPEDISLDKERSISVFRILQESLTNVARHANATEVAVRLEKRDSKVVMTVKDNGRGMSKDYQSDSGSFGLIGMKERALSLGGELKIESYKDKGTTIAISVPLTAKNI